MPVENDGEMHKSGGVAVAEKGETENGSTIDENRLYSPEPDDINADIQDSVDAAADKYVAPKGGGGVSYTLFYDGNEVVFGHGGRHILNENLNYEYVNRIIAKNAIKNNLEVGGFKKEKVQIDGYTIEYTCFRLSNTKINIGTYYIKERYE